MNELVTERKKRLNAHKYTHRDWQALKCVCVVKCGQRVESRSKTKMGATPSHEDDGENVADPEDSDDDDDILKMQNGRYRVSLWVFC